MMEVFETLLDSAYIITKLNFYNYLVWKVKSIWQKYYHLGSPSFKFEVPAVGTVIK
jgi:hypothetical protein